MKQDKIEYHSSDRNRLKKSLFKAFLVTVFAMCLSMLIANPFAASLSTFFSSPEKSDFRITDLYTQFADSRNVRLLEDRILLVDIGFAGREEIAEALELLSLCEPKAVGIDINFAEPRENDSTLLSALAHLPQAVLPLGVEQLDNGKFAVSDHPFFFNRLQGINYGVINLPAEREGASIREYMIDYPMKDGTRIPSFVTAVAKAANDEALDALFRRGRSRETIDYPSREYRAITLDQIPDNIENIAGRYVLVGALEEVGDMHSTPINSYLSGLKIHAYALSSLLDGKWYENMPQWVDYAVAFILCFIIIFLADFITGKARGITIRFLQLLFIFAIVWAGYAVYLDRGWICNFSHALLMIAFGLLALDIWNGSGAILTYGYKRVKNRKNKKLNII